MENAKLILERDQGLIKSNAISRQELETQVTLVKEQEAVVFKSDLAQDE
ncbi:MAG: hypothetical protein QM811_08635 [Pirellulales bacterium]